MLTALLLTAVLQVIQERRPDDPWFPQQASFWSPGGTAVLSRRSHRAGTDTLTIAPGIALEAPRAWALTTGSHAVIVALLDDGFFYRHEDIAGNLWHNPGESGRDASGLPHEANGVDDDGNGYVDDVIGWDFVFGDPDPDPYAFDGMDRSRIQPYWHSISAMGIIGAVGNNGIGVAGINWTVSLMPLRIAPRESAGANGTRPGSPPRPARSGTPWTTAPG